MSRIAVTLTQLTQPHPVIGFIHIPLQHHNRKEGSIVLTSHRAYLRRLGRVRTEPGACCDAY